MYPSVKSSRPTALRSCGRWLRCDNRTPSPTEPTYGTRKFAVQCFALLCCALVPHQCDHVSSQDLGSMRDIQSSGQQQASKRGRRPANRKSQQLAPCLAASLAYACQLAWLRSPLVWGPILTCFGTRMIATHACSPCQTTSSTTDWTLDQITRSHLNSITLAFCWPPVSSV